MKNIFAGILFALAINPVLGQQFRFGVDLIAAQYMRAPMTKSLLLDTALQNNEYFYMDHITQKKIQTDFPGGFVQWDTKKKFYFRFNARVSRLKVNVGSSFTDERRDTLLLNTNWTILRPVIGLEAGYLFGKKVNHFFLSSGITVSQLRFQNQVVKYYGYNDYDATNFYNYFNSSPLFASIQFRAGIKRKAFSLNMCYQHSFTKVDHLKYVSGIGYLTVEISWDIYRTGFITKKQYKTTDEITNLNYKTNVDLKKKSSSTGLHLPGYLMAMNKPYTNAYSDSSSNYLVYVKDAPEVRFFPEFYGNHAKAFNAKKTLYTKQEYGITAFTMIYHNAVRRSFYNNIHPDLQNSNDLVITSNDIKQRYFRLFYSYKVGFRFKTGRKSFLYYELGLRYSMTLKSYREKVFVPYLNKSLFWGNSEIGFQVGHQGVNIGIINTLGKPDKYMIYKNINVLYIGLYHEISSK